MAAAALPAAAAAGAAPAAAGSPALRQLNPSETSTLYRAFKASRPPPGHSKLTGQFDLLRAGLAADLHVSTDAPERVVLAVGLAGPWRSISLDESLPKLRKIDAWQGMGVLAFSTASCLAVPRVQFLEDPARAEHWGLSPAVPLNKNEFDALLLQMEINHMQAAADVPSAADDDFPPREQQSLYCAALRQEWENEQDDAERIFCHYALVYSQRFVERQDRNAVDVNPQDFKNRMNLRDRAFVTYAFRRVAKAWEDANPHGAVQLLSEARELLAVPLRAAFHAPR
jgi:hypothetical protein